MSKPTRDEMRINPDPCTRQEERENWGMISGYPDKFRTEELYAGSVQDAIDGRLIYHAGALYVNNIYVGGAEATGRVKCTENDDFAFLYEQFADGENPSGYAAGDLYCKVGLVNAGTPNEELDIYVDITTIHGHNGGNQGSWALEYDYDEERWQLVDPADDFKVKVNADDTAAFLEDQFENETASLPSKYIDISSVTIDDAGDKKIQLILDYTAISGYSAGDKQYLAHDTSGDLLWVTASTSECAS